MSYLKKERSYLGEPTHPPNRSSSLPYEQSLIFADEFQKLRLLVSAFTKNLLGENLPENFQVLKDLRELVL